jgi:hypothetical protein
VLSNVQIRLNAIENYIKELEQKKARLYREFKRDEYAAFERGQVCAALVEAKAHRRSLKELLSTAQFIDELHEKKVAEEIGA